MNSETLVRQLRDENAALRQLVAELQARLVQLQQALETAEKRIAELEQAKKESPHFIKPNRPPRQAPQAPRRARAKEHNHGRKRAMTVTQRVEHPIEQCGKCGGKLRKARVAWRREVIDLPAPQAVEVTEHVVWKGYCPHCERWEYAQVEAGVGRRRFGPRLMALVGYLSESLRLPYAVIRSYLGTLHGVQLSEGAIADLRRGLARQLQAFAEGLQEQVRHSAIVHTDETGWREEGQNGYVWTFSTPGEGAIRYYHYDHSRGQQVVEQVLGETFHGVLGSDFYGGYNGYRGPHQRCWTHLLGDLHDLKEQHPNEATVQRWSQAVRALYERAIALVRSGEPGQEERRQLYVTLWKEVWQLGLCYARAEHPCQALAKRLLRHQDELFQFVLVAGLAADNNLAERSLRPRVVVRKISGGTRSAQGSRTRMTLASVFATLKARGLNPFTACLALIGSNSCT